jgi:4-hydroxy-tetrahydrodipicolinate synthase
VADVVFAAVPTPFTSDGDVDTEAAGRLYGFLAGVVDGLLVAGTTGEFPALDDGERLALIQAGLDAVGPDRLIAHIGAPDSRRAARLAVSAVALGATRIAAITPYYMAPRPDEVTAYYDRIRQAAAGAGLYAYIYPERTGVTVPPEQFASLAEAVGLAGAKLSGAAARNVAACATACPGLKIYSGDDSDLAATLRDGGAGIISARAAAYPEVFSALSAALAAGEAEVAARYQADVTAIASTGASIGRVKEALRVRGFGSMAARTPVDVPDETTAARIAELVKSLIPVPGQPLPAPDQPCRGSLVTDLQTSRAAGEPGGVDNRLSL